MRNFSIQKNFISFIFHHVNEWNESEFFYKRKLFHKKCNDFFYSFLTNVKFRYRKNISKNITWHVYEPFQLYREYAQLNMRHLKKN